MKTINLFLALALVSSSASAGRTITKPTPTLQIQLDDSSNWLSNSQKNLLKSNLDAAFNSWATNFNSAAKVVARVEISTNTVSKRIESASTSNTPVKTVNGVIVVEESTAYKIRTGLSVIASQADLVIRIDPDYLNQEVWLDPRPNLRIDPIPDKKVDAVSLLAHELGHAFGMQTFRDLDTGAPYPGYMTVYDQYVNISTYGFSFVGPNGAPVTLTAHYGPQNIRHFSDSLNDSLTADLMSGTTFYYSWRYRPSPTDLSVLNTLGIPMK